VNLRFWKKQEIYGVTLSEPGTSSQVSGDYYPYVRPEVDFATCYDYYRTIGKVQNAVESYVSEILSRDWYFEGDKNAVRACEEWEERFNLSRLIEYIVRDWLVCGNSIIGVSDWQPVQISSVAGLKRSPYGQPEQFVQLVNGNEVRLDASRFIHTQYIELNREAWGIGMFHSLLSTFAYGKKRSLPHLEIYRRQIQLFYRILERYGSPVTVWFFENVARAEFDRQVEELRALEPGDRRILSKKVEIATETIDGRGNLINATSPVINQEIEAGLQTSANRLITQPSAMADARISEEKDSARLLGIMEKIRRMMNALVIPRITSGKAEFRWGKQDSFQFDFGQLLQAKSAGFVSAEEGRAILKSVGWKLDDHLFNNQTKEAYPAGKPEQSFYDVQEFNPNHDPNTGRFASGGGSGSGRRKYRNPSHETTKLKFDNYKASVPKRNDTFDPDTGKGYAFKQRKAKEEFYQQYGDGKRDIALISATNNLGDLNENTEKVWNDLDSKGEKLFIGRWRDKTHNEFTDVTFMRLGLSDQEIRGFLKKYNHQDGAVITKDGKLRLVHNE